MPGVSFHGGVCFCAADAGQRQLCVCARVCDREVEREVEVERGRERERAPRTHTQHTHTHTTHTHTYAPMHAIMSFSLSHRTCRRAFRMRTLRGCRTRLTDCRGWICTSPATTCSNRATSSSMTRFAPCVCACVCLCVCVVCACVCLYMQYARTCLED